MKRTRLKQGNKPLKRSRVKPISAKGQIRRAREKALDTYLTTNRAKGRCEICGREPDFRGLSGAHIEPRDYTGANDTAENKVISCGRCHDHGKFFKGICITQAEAKKLVDLLNKEHGIDPKMTGADVLKINNKEEGL